MRRDRIIPTYKRHAGKRSRAKRTALLRKLKGIFRRYRSQPVDRVIQLINPMLRGWVNYFAVGHSQRSRSRIGPPPARDFVPWRFPDACCWCSRLSVVTQASGEPTQ
jgi:hypothetical protein